MTDEQITFIQPTLTNRDTFILNTIKERRKRLRLFSSAVHFVPGDIIGIVYWKRAYKFSFEGICIKTSKKHFRDSNTSFTLRNVLSGVGIELTISYYYNRAFHKMVTLDYKRKQFIYRKSKLYYLRTKMNRASRVK